jgi:hypothetical protein
MTSSTSVRRQTYLFLLTLGLALAAPAAIAQEGPNLRTMTCAAAKQTVKSQGSAILNSGPNVFNRYVRDAAYCMEDQWLQGAWVRTQDNPKCFIGYICADESGW